MNEETAIPDPIYKHDCDVCIYLGSYQLDVDYDLYLCQASKTVIARWGYVGSYQLDVDYDLYLRQASKTVIARWGSEGPQYDSGLALITHDSVIAVAARRALAYYMGIRKYWEV